MSGTHAPLYRAVEVARFESACECGSRFVKDTPVDANRALDVHLHVHAREGADDG